MEILARQDRKWSVLHSNQQFQGSQSTTSTCQLHKRGCGHAWGVYILERPWDSLSLHLNFLRCVTICHLVGGLNPMIIPNIWKIKHVPNDQPAIMSLGFVQCLSPANPTERYCPRGECHSFPLSSMSLGRLYKQWPAARCAANFKYTWMHSWRTCWRISSKQWFDSSISISILVSH